MSIVSTVANYGGRVDNNINGIKQFIVSGSASVSQWIYKKFAAYGTVQTPATNRYPVLIDSDLYVTGTIYSTSDAKLKQNVTDVERDVVDSIMQLRPVQYEYIPSVSCHLGPADKGKTHFGLLAQEVEPLLPSLITMAGGGSNPHTGYKVMNYQELVPLLLAKVQRMQAEIDELRCAGAPVAAPLAASTEDNMI